ncbi:MAG: pseudouridine-5'-phosphate glycosidase [Bacteroidota bacterium]
MSFPLHISPAVEAALASGKPVVALESTIIAHGMPYPQNVQTARELEALIREEGCEPATLAVLYGQIKIGLTDSELELLGQEPDVMKASRRDLPYAISAKKHAATTVAATMILAEMAGIRVFATGGIGGVHREAEKTFDISADLQELGRTSVAVVSAGAKAILDLKLTLEYLETMGVPVVGMGTEEFPAFYTPHSGLKLSLTLDTPKEIAYMLHTKWAMGLDGGVLIANPIPEKYAMPRHLVQNVVDQALREAKLSGIGGKSLTPYLLGRIKALTKGQSLFSNIALVKHNARVAAQVARELGELGE